MGIRFRCHHCEYELHVKDFQGGRRGRCPKCQGKFRIPQQDAEHSISVAADADGAAIGPASEPQPVEGGAQMVTAPQNEAAMKAPAQKSAGIKKPAKEPSSQGTSGDKASAERQIESGAQPEMPALLTPQAQQSAERSQPELPRAEPELPRAITDAPEATWYVRPTTGGQFGPAPSETFVQWLIEGRIERDALVWRDDWPEWVSSTQAFADYFDPQAPFQATSPVLAPSGDAQPVPVPIPAPAATSLSERNRLGRKQRKRRRYIVFLSVLTVLFICLMVALVVVLMQQS